GGGRQVAGELDRTIPGLDVDDHPARDEVLRLGERTVDDGGAPLAVEADERAVGRQRLAVDVLAAVLEASGEIAHEPDVGVDLLRRPAVHRWKVDGRGRTTAVVLEQQILHGWSPFVAAPTG